MTNLTTEENIPLENELDYLKDIEGLEEESKEDKEIIQKESNKSNRKGDIEQGRGMTDDEEDNMPPLHYCSKMELYLPYRAKYCNECEAVVAKFDHHCFWLGGCVGELNHHKFWIMTFLMTLNYSLTLYYVRI